MYTNYLYHHGIKGQKWGVRRYQNSDGSLTNAGRKRYDDGGKGSNKRHIDKKGIAKKVAAGVAIAGTAALTAYALSNPRIREALLDKMKEVSPKVKDFVTENGKKAVKSLGDSAKKAGKAMSDAAMMSAGTIAIVKLGDKLATDDNASQAIKDRNQILLDTATAGIKSVTNANSKSGSNNSSNNGNSSGNNVGAEITNLIGSPSNRGIDKSSSAYQNLFKDSSGNQRDSDTRATIKSLASAGYDIDQIQKYLDSMHHSGLILTPVDIGQLYIASLL